MIDAVIDSPVTVLVGVGILAIGYLIKYREWTFLIAGYDESAAVPRSVAANIAGNLVIRIGIATAIFGVLTAISSIPQAISVAFGALIVLATARAVYRLQTYQPAPTR